MNLFVCNLRPWKLERLLTDFSIDTVYNISFFFFFRNMSLGRSDDTNFVQAIHLEAQD